jgi:hypothetical protein
MAEIAHLLILIRPKESGPFLRDTACGGVESSEAAEITSRLFELIKDYFPKWQWPDSESHLRNWQVPSDSIHRVQHSEESDDEFRERLQLLDSRTQRQTRKEAEWIQYAFIVYRSLRCLNHASKHGRCMHGSVEGVKYDFSPRRLYEYIWMCLYQGLDQRCWKVEAEQPPPDLEAIPLAEWYTKKAGAIIKEIRTRWDQGEELRKLVPLWNVDEISRLHSHLSS